MTVEYAEDYVDVRTGWAETLNTHADDGWRLVFVLPDEFDDGDDSRIEGRFRLIFEREVTDG